MSRAWWATVAVVGAGMALRLVQYLGQVDMWHDELALARNVADRDLLDLVTRPLDHLQVAPAGFMILLEATTSALGVDEAALRLGPLLLGLASVPLFWAVARRYASGMPLLAAVTLFGLSPALVWYGSSVKPYGGDVATSLLLVWLAVRYLERPDSRRRAATGAVIGGLALLLSFPAVPTAALLGLVLLVGWWRTRPRPAGGPLALLCAGWATGAAVAGAAALAQLDPATEAFMRDFWAGDFPDWTRPWAALAWSGGRLHAVVGHLLFFVPLEGWAMHLVVGGVLALAVLGLTAGRSDSRPPILLLLAPPLAGVVAASVHLLPFDQRLGLHAGWPFLVLTAVGLEVLRRRSPPRLRFVAPVLAILVPLPLVLAVLLVSGPPYHPDPVRPVLEELASRHRPGEPIYVYTQGRHDMAYYGQSLGLEGWIQGERHYDRPRDYLLEVDPLRRHPRAWFFWVQLDDRSDPEVIRSYLGSIGREIERIPEEDAAASGAILYDLSDPERLARHTWLTFPLPSPGDPQPPTTPSDAPGDDP